MKLEKYSKYGDLLLRVVIGLIFIIAGYGKLFGAPGIEGFSGMLAGIGFPLAAALAVVIGIIELVGGLMLLVGLWTKIPATLLAIIMLVAVITVHLKNGWADFRYPLLLFAALITYIVKPNSCSIMDLKK